MNLIQIPSNCAVSRRWVNVILLITVFFLPLHFHVATASSAQINQECSCVHGSRTQLGQIAPPLTSVVLVCDFAFLLDSQVAFIPQSVRSHLSRAPPAV
jgi:hypothetical protein